MEVLSTLIAEADCLQVLTPLPGDSIKYRASVYADDLVTFLGPLPNDFICIHQLLQLFDGASGLDTNVDKFLITPIRCSEEEINIVRLVFPCERSLFGFAN